MTKALYLIPVFALLISSIACKTQVSDSNTAKMDSTMAVLKSALDATNALDEKQLEKNLKTYDEFFEFYSNDYKDVSNSDFYTHELADMAECRKYVRKTQMALSGWKTELQLSLDQLEKLKHDYVEKLLEDQEIKVHLNAELQASYNVVRQIDKYVGVTAGCTRSFNDLVGKLDSTRTAYLKAND